MQKPNFTAKKTATLLFRMIAVFLIRYHSPHKEAAEKAAQDVGKLLRKVLTDDKYKYVEEFGNRECTYHRASQ